MKNPLWHLFMLSGFSFSLDLENGSGPRDLLIKCKALMIQDATMNEVQEKKVPAWAKELNSVRKYYFSGAVDDLNSLLELHRRNTLCTFGIRVSVLKC